MGGIKGYEALGVVVSKKEDRYGMPCSFACIVLPCICQWWHPSHRPAILPHVSNHTMTMMMMMTTYNSCCIQVRSWAHSTMLHSWLHQNPALWVDPRIQNQEDLVQWRERPNTMSTAVCMCVCMDMDPMLTWPPKAPSRKSSITLWNS